MGNYTPEQVEWAAERMEREGYGGDMLRAYAATLRQQAGRVNEGMVDAACRAAMAFPTEAPLAISQDQMRAALTAALAQNTQGEAQCRGPGWCEACSRAVGCCFHGERCDRRDCPCPKVLGAELRACVHTERARVPDVDAMVNRFLGWTLPKDFAPDAGISFTPIPNPNGNPYPWPSGTNLLDADQAKAMFEYVLANAPPPPVESVRVPPGWALVPIKPTEEMLAQAATHDTEPRTAETDQWNRDTWSFMLESAPEYAAPSQRAEVK